MKSRSFLFGLLLMAACGSRERAARPAGVDHLFRAGAVETLDLSRIGELTAVSGLAVGSFVRQEARLAEPGVAGGEITYHVLPAFEASVVDVLELDVEGLPAPAGATLAWSAGAAAPPEEATIVARVPSHTGDERQTLRFELAAEPRWQGRIEDLRLRLAGASGGFHLVAARTWKRVLSPAALAGMTGRTFRVELGHEVREAVLLRPGKAWRREIRAAPGSTIRLAVAATPGVAAPVEIRLRLEPRVPGTNSPTELRRTFGTVRGEIGNWLEWQVPTGSFEGEISVEWLAQGAGLDGARGLVFLADPAVVSPRPEGRPNVLLISLDTLRADHLSLYGYPRATSPELDAWAGRNAVVFDNVIAAAGSTLPSHTSMLTGLDVLHHGAIGSSPAGEALETLAERFRAQGYTTRAWTGGAFLDPRFGLAQGFEVFRFWPRGEVEASQEIEDGFGRARRWMSENLEEPFFLFLHTYEIHGPYRAREPWWSRFRGAGEATRSWSKARIWPRSRAAEATVDAPLRPGEDPFRAAGLPVVQFGRLERPLAAAELPGATDFYDSGIAKADLELGRLLADLDRLGLTERTIVVITADHGESLGEHGLWSHGYLFEDNLRVPLVIAIPGRREAGLRVSSPVGLVDLAPTLLELAGLPVLGAIDGRSLVSWVETGKADDPERTYLSYAWDTKQGVALRRGWHKLVMRDSLLASRAQPELFDLRADPGENHNLAADPAMRTQLEELHREAWRRLVAPRQSGVTFQVANRGSRFLTAAFRLPGKSPAGFRVAAPLCSGCVELTLGGDLELRLPPGQFVRFWVSAERPRIEVELEVPPGGPTYRRELVREGLCGRALDVTPPNPHRLIVTASIEGSCATPAGPSGALEDAALRARLEALGYL